ncbi:hypothetical protein ABPG74_018592 [Tetrahymena malaccensis]
MQCQINTNTNNCSQFNYQNTCSRCQDGFYLDQNNQCQKCNQGSTCSQCNPGYYLNSNGQCQPCITGCLDCNQQNTCNICNDGYYLDQNGKCLYCDSNCTFCINSNTCIACKSGLQLDQTGKCFTCNQQCKTCNSLNTCTSCNNGFYLDTNNQCKSCMKGCILCNNSSSCIACDNQYYLDVNNKCQSCVENCQLCSSSNNCFACIDNYFLDQDNTCKSCCPCSDGYFLQNQFQCSPCLDPRCLKCTDMNQLQIDELEHEKLQINKNQTNVENDSELSNTTIKQLAQQKADQQINQQMGQQDYEKEQIATLKVQTVQVLEKDQIEENNNKNSKNKLKKSVELSKIIELSQTKQNGELPNKFIEKDYYDKQLSHKSISQQENIFMVKNQSEQDQKQKDFENMAITNIKRQITKENIDTQNNLVDQNQINLQYKPNQQAQQYGFNNQILNDNSRLYQIQQEQDGEKQIQKVGNYLYTLIRLGLLGFYLYNVINYILGYGLDDTDNVSTSWFLIMLAIDVVLISSLIAFCLVRIESVLLANLITIQTHLINVKNVSIIAIFVPTKVLVFNVFKAINQMIISNVKIL